MTTLDEEKNDPRRRTALVSEVDARDDRRRGRARRRVTRAVERFVPS
jgi:hypothetical protein|tara:strand:- start:548 stop:688 length:141 start_codon:yes stop_codon:yes gene_type:complete